MKAAYILVARVLANVMMLAPIAPGVAAADGVHGAIQRDARSGTVRLIARGTPVRFEIDKLCRYDPESSRWYRQGVPAVDKVLGADVVVVELADSVGLYWLRWKENGRPFASMAVAGPVLCNDIALAPSSRSDVIASCIPLPHSARAAYVPDPNIHCGQ
jgi:hypothetical protein